MIKVNVILDHSKWKNKIKNPSNYLKKNLENYLDLNIFKKKNKNFLFY